MKQTKQLAYFPNEEDARRALFTLGVPPTRALIRSWLQAARAEEEAGAQGFDADARHQRTTAPANVNVRPAGALRPAYRRGSSRSRLEPVLRAQGAFRRKRGRQKRGRPRIAASWFRKLAGLMADGTPLKTALKRAGITLDAAQVRALYRNTEFRRMYRKRRRTGGQDG
jgi:hypothetical protein